MEIASIVEQIHNSPDLWATVKWGFGALFGLIGYLWWRIERNFNREIEELEDSLKTFRKRVIALEKEVIKDYVSYTVFNTVVKDLKDEVHNSMREVKEELHSINKFLRDGNNK